MARYVRLPAREARLRPQDLPDAPETVYFGGGTPSLLGAEGFSELVRTLREEGGVDLRNAAEWTVELNPASVTRDLLRVLRREGVNRLSLGAQSFCDATLSRIGRIHNAEAIVSAFSLAREEGFDDLGLDLIANLPGVTDGEWRDTVGKALRLKPRHISVYALIVEPGTPFAELAARGELGPRLDDEGEMDLLRATAEWLASEGFTRYEISNYGLPGFFCRHNLAVWHGEDYTGLGPAASSRNGLVRRTNAADLDGYEKALLANDLPPTSHEERLDTEADATERFLYGLRLREGVSPDAFARRHVAAAERAREWKQRLSALESSGIVTRFENAEGATAWRLTARGTEVCDAVLAELA
jgi:oxygen-independent coproporphyrinogen-3 oxidase